jgi:hypothetical protein
MWSTKNSLPLFVANRMLKQSLFSPARPEAAKTVSLPKGCAFSHASFSHRSALQRRPGRLTTRRRAQTWCSLFVAPCAPEGTPQASTRSGLAWDKARLGAPGLGG